MHTLELWGGPECTVNRVGDRFTDQFSLSGHEHRADDIDRFASLGITALRYPLLWERVERIGWEWHDERMARISALGMRPIAGLIHHGSGPAHTALTDDSGFAAGLAAQAAEAARRYPHVRDWTPVNEPLTTARFSALYGLWFPHAQDEAAFYRALLNQIDATRLSMRQIRRIIPGARLVQTEDLGRTFATSTLARQARHDNLRRWLTWICCAVSSARDTASIAGSRPTALANGSTRLQRIRARPISSASIII
jgi:dTDP-4-dehydrorhamnose reductase